MIQEGFGMHGLTADLYFAEVGQYICCGSPVGFESNKNNKKSFVGVRICVGADMSTGVLNYGYRYI